MNDYATTQQKQIQEQKTTFRAGGTLHWISQLVWAGIFLLFTFGVLGFVLWKFGGVQGKAIDLSTIFIAGCVLAWCLYHWAWRQHYKTRQAEMASKFFSHPLMVIGDRSTEGFIPYYIPAFPESEGDVKQQFVESEPLSRYAAPILTMEQMREKAIQDRYDNGVTMSQIVKDLKDSPLFEPPTLNDVRKALCKTGKE